MPRNLKITLAILSVAVIIGLISLRGLHQRIQNLSETQSSEEEARRDLLKPTVSTPTDVLVQAKMFWASGPDALTPVTLELPLSADPVKRGRQVLDALIANVPDDSRGERTLPADATVLGFYILPDGTAVADFSDALASETPSGILSEQMAVNSIARTLENSVPILHRLKILIHGQEAETLAGHVDLTGFFDLNPPAAARSATAPPNSSVPPRTSASPPVTTPTKPSR